MRLEQILAEDISQPAAIKNITDILSTELPELYRRLGKMAEQFEYNNGPIGEITATYNNPKKFAFIIGSQKAQWYKSVFDTQLKSSLYALTNTLPKSLRAELNKYTDEAMSNGKFSHIENSLIPLIKRIGQTIKSDQLIAGANAAKSAMDAFNATVESLWNGEESGHTDEPVTQKQASGIGQQNAAADQLINGVLSDLDKRVAGEIRNAIAKSGNKLAALQSELKKRGLAESLSYIASIIDK